MALSIFRTNRSTYDRTNSYENGVFTVDILKLYSSESFTSSGTFEGIYQL